MTGRVGGKNNDVRTFGVSRGITVPKTNNVLKHRVPAAPLESAVKGMIRQVLLNRPGIEDAIKRLVAQEMGQKKHDCDNLHGLTRERDRKRKQLAVLSDDVSMDEDDALSRKIVAVKADIRSLGKRIAEVKEQRPQEPVDVGTVAAKVAKEFEDLGRQIDQADIPHLERIAGILLNKNIEVDLETKQVEAEFSLPSWMGQVLSRHGPVGLDELSAYKQFMEAHPENRVILGIFRCDGQGRPVCFACRRVKRAA